jgi:hypothetical protein
VLLTSSTNTPMKGFIFNDLGTDNQFASTGYVYIKFGVSPFTRDHAMDSSTQPLSTSGTAKGISFGENEGIQYLFLYTGSVCAVVRYNSVMLVQERGRTFSCTESKYYNVFGSKNFVND